MKHALNYAPLHAEATLCGAFNVAAKKKATSFADSKKPSKNAIAFFGCELLNSCDTVDSLIRGVNQNPHPNQHSYEVNSVGYKSRKFSLLRT